MKILYTNFHCGNGGGHDTYILGLASVLQHDYRVTIAAPRSSRLAQLVQAYPRVTFEPIEFKSRWPTALCELLRLRALIVRERFDVIHVNGSADHRGVMLALVGLRHKPPVLFTKHNTLPTTTFGNRLRARIATTHTIAVSDFVRRLLRTEGVYRKISVIRHGICHRRFAPPSSQDALARRARLFGDAAGSLIVLGSVAGTTDEKGWFDLIDALALLPQPIRGRFRVVLAGTPLSTDQQARLERSGVASQVRVWGLVDPAQVLTIADVAFVLSYRESLSYACREAMSMGRPVLISDAGGLPENLTDGVQGWIVPRRSPAAIARLLHALAADPALIREAGQAAYLKSRQEFSMDEAIGRTLSVYRSICVADC